MSSARPGPSTSDAEVTNISRHGFWVLLDGREMYLPFDEFPWFRSAPVEAILRVERPQPDHLYWPVLDPFFSMNILDPIKVLRIEGNSVVDVTTRYPYHLRWRLGLLREIRAANSGECSALVDSVISYLERRMVEVQADTPLQATPEGTCQRRH